MAREETNSTLREIAAIPQSDVDSYQERRQSTERRKPTISILLFGFLHTRRRYIRRAVDQQCSYLDWYDSRLLYITLGVLLLSFADGVLTLNLLAHGSVELNPLMALLIAHDIQVFVVAKFALTGMGLVFLVVHHNFRLFQSVTIGDLLHVALLLYIILIAYELILLAGIHA